MSRDDYDDPAYGFYEWVATQHHQQHPYVTPLMIRWANTVLTDLGQYLEDEHDVRLWNALSWEARLKRFRLAGSPHDNVWISGFRLISSVYQLEKFVRLHMQLHGVNYTISDFLRTVRNSLEHLEDSIFQADAAVANPQGSRGQSISRLPGGRLRMEWTPDYSWKALGLISIGAIARRAESLAGADILETVLEWTPDPVDYEKDPGDDRYRRYPLHTAELEAVLQKSTE